MPARLVRKANTKSSALPIRESKVTVEGQTGTNRGTPSTVDIMQNLGAWDRAVPTKSVHHPRIRRHGKGAAQRAMAKREREHKSTGRWAHPYPQKNIATITITYRLVPNPIFSSSSLPASSGDATYHQNNCTLLPDRVQEDLRYWLTCRRCDRRPVILNREEQTQDKEPAEDCRDSDRRDDANWSRHGRVVSLLGHMRARIES